MRQTLTLPAMVAVCLSPAVLICDRASAQDRTPFLQSDIPFDYSRGRNVGVLERARPEFSSEGILVGSLSVRGALQVNGVYDSNVYVQPENEHADGGVLISPSIGVNTNWSRNALFIGGDADILRYANADLRAENGWSARTGGNFQLGLYSKLTADARISKEYDSRLSPGTPNGIISSIGFRRNVGRLSYEFQKGRIRLIGAGNYTTLAYGSTVDEEGVRREQSSRDRREVRAIGQAEYALSPDTSLFTQLTYINTEYDTPVGLNPNRDSSSVRALAGISFDITELMRGKIGGGYLTRDYKSPLYSDLRNFSLEARVEWFPTPLTTVTLNAERAVQDSVVSVSGGFLRTSADVRVDHELLRNLLLNATASYAYANYGGIAATSRIQRYTTGARYLVNPRWSLNTSVEYSKRNNSGAFRLPEFSQFYATLGISAAL